MLTKKDINLIKIISFVDFKLRFNSSVLGFFWSLLNPLLMLTVLYIVFSILMKSPIEHYQLILLLGIISWNFFSVCTMNGMTSILNKASLINKAYFKKEILIIASCLTSFYSFLLNLVIFVIIMLISGVNFHFTNLYFIIPLLLIFCLSLGISFGLSAFYIKFRDLNEIWTVLLQAGFFLAPVIYPISLIPEKYLKFYMLNPLSRIITESRDSLISHSFPTFPTFLKTLIICISILLIGYILFKIREPYMAEEL
ncbi:ABC transporter permease [bacterium]|nr:MAG: ABC transporter permease [bacterium]